MSEEFFAYGETLPDAYHKALYSLWCAGEEVPCPDYNTTTLDCTMTFVVLHPLQEPMISKLSFCGPYDLEQYRQEMLDGILDFEVENGKWDYTYHQRMTDWDFVMNDFYGRVWQDEIDQICFVIEELRRNPYSRRAVIDIRNNYRDMFSSDPACMQHLQFFVRDGKLNLKVLFRSNDAVKASFSNAFALILLQKRIADELGYEVGTYTHRANSFHCYERDFDMLKGYVKRIEESVPCHDLTNAAPENLCYNYVGGWDLLMEECKPLIETKVKNLKEMA